MTKNKTADSSEPAIELSNGVAFSFGSLMAGDMLDAVAELGCSLEEADAFRSSMVLTWLSAGRGGYEGDFRSFVDQIPVGEVKDLVEAAAPFLGTSAA
jgi:hypothetical protein